MRAWRGGRALVRLAAGMMVAGLAAVGSAERTSVTPFSAELDPYPIQPSSVTATAEEIYARTITPANRAEAAIVACRKQVVAMYRSIGIDISVDRYAQRRFLPKHWSPRTPLPLAGDFPLPFSSDCPLYHAIPSDSPRVALPHGYVSSFHVATVGAGGDGWGIGVAISGAKDPLRTVVQTWDRDDPRPADRRIQLHARADLEMFFPANRGDRHLVMIDAVGLTSTCTWHVGVAGDVLTGWRVHGPHPLGSLGIGEGTNAAELSDLVGLLRPGEATASKPIRHALYGPAQRYWKAIAFPAINWDEWVGASDGGTGAVPYGGVIQLDPALDLAATRLSLPALRILEAIQRYGWYLHDTGVRDLDVWSAASGAELGGSDREIRDVLAHAQLYVVPAPMKYAGWHGHAAATGPVAPVTTDSPPAVANHPHQRVVSAADLVSWDARLFAIIRARIAAGRPALYRSGVFATDAAITRADADGALTLHSQLGDVTWSWARITRDERRSLAAKLDAATPADHCVIAFHLLESGDRESARPHLFAGGEEAARVAELFP
ncbi:MAG: hypothetical protein H0X38_09550 [Planctomycetes bacterium]|nr:hypothetical protein [Planctomycetota bacterium]